MLATLAGGVGAARFLAGLVRVVEPSDVVAVVNTADDDEFHGLYVSPDLDSVTYTLAGASNTAQGWGLEGETFATLDALGALRRRHLVPARRQGSRDPPLPHRSPARGRAALGGHGRDHARLVDRRPAHSHDRRSGAHPHHRAARRGCGRRARDAALVRRRAGRATGGVGPLRRRGHVPRRARSARGAHPGRHHRASAPRTR